MDRLHDLATADAVDGTVVACDTQTAGRGRDGRTWSSPPGGVWVAVLLRAPIPTPGAVVIRAGLLVANVVDALLGGPRAQLKWPNDVMLDGRKLAGVLCEGRWAADQLQWMVVGIGINVCNPPPAEARMPAIALAQVLPGVRRIDVLDGLVPGFGVLRGLGPGLSAAEREAFAKRDVLAGVLLRSPVPGRARGVGDDGALLVETAGRLVAVREGRIGLA